MTPVTDPAFASPSLVTGDAAPAFELKFLLDHATAATVEQWATRSLTLDPYGDPALSGAYRTTSIYCDTPELDVLHGSPAYGRRKFRVRRYGSAQWAFLERKKKWGDRVEKQRVAVPVSELSFLNQSTVPTDWPGSWFHERLHSLRLGPVCRVTYDRTAFAGICNEGPLRLTLDRHLYGQMADQWQLDPVVGGRSLLAEGVILELKFRNAMPQPFKALVAELGLSPSRVSKYRLCHAAGGEQIHA